MQRLSEDPCVVKYLLTCLIISVLWFPECCLTDRELNSRSLICTFILQTFQHFFSDRCDENKLRLAHMPYTIFHHSGNKTFYFFLWMVVKTYLIILTLTRRIVLFSLIGLINSIKGRLNMWHSGENTVNNSYFRRYQSNLGWFLLRFSAFCQHWVKETKQVYHGPPIARVCATSLTVRHPHTPWRRVRPYRWCDSFASSGRKKKKEKKSAFLSSADNQRVNIPKWKWVAWIFKVISTQKNKTRRRKELNVCRRLSYSARWNLQDVSPDRLRHQKHGWWMVKMGITALCGTLSNHIFIMKSIIDYVYYQDDTSDVCAHAFLNTWMKARKQFINQRHLSKVQLKSKQCWGWGGGSKSLADLMQEWGWSRWMCIMQRRHYLLQHYSFCLSTRLQFRAPVTDSDCRQKKLIAYLLFPV